MLERKYSIQTAHWKQRQILELQQQVKIQNLLLQLHQVIKFVHQGKGLYLGKMHQIYLLKIFNSLSV